MFEILQRPGVVRSTSNSYFRRFRKETRSPVVVSPARLRDPDIYTYVPHVEGKPKAVVVKHQVNDDAAVPLASALSPPDRIFSGAHSAGCLQNTTPKCATKKLPCQDASSDALDGRRQARRRQQQ